MPRVVEALDDDKTSLGLRYDEESAHIVCPWHGYEYDIRSGRHVGNDRVRLKSYLVKVMNDKVYVVV